MWTHKTHPWRRARYKAHLDEANALWQEIADKAQLDLTKSFAPRAVCTAGRRPGPAEDCGGVSGYELISAATDPTHADHTDAVAEYAHHFGFDADPTFFRPTTFDIGEINNALADLGLDGADERDFDQRARPTPDGVTFARAALTKWPTG